MFTELQKLKTSSEPQISHGVFGTFICYGKKPGKGSSIKHLRSHKILDPLPIFKKYIL